jgi:hypothetical protein
MSNETTAKPERTELFAADLLKSSHPLHSTFSAWVVERGTEATKRQARLFLATHPEYRTSKTA